MILLCVQGTQPKITSPAKFEVSFWQLCQAEWRNKRLGKRNPRASRAPWGCSKSKEAENYSFSRQGQESNLVGDAKDKKAMQRLEEQQMQQCCWVVCSVQGVKQLVNKAKLWHHRFCDMQKDSWTLVLKYRISMLVSFLTRGKRDSARMHLSEFSSRQKP